MLKKNGVACKEEYMEKLPSDIRKEKGPFAMIECFQRIPCDPCVYSCPIKAIMPMSDINDIPRVDFDKCNGCASCVVKCPGLAIFVVDLSKSSGKAVLKMAYELLPVPAVGDEVVALSREGKELCKAKVVEVRDGKINDKTYLLGIELDREYIYEVRAVRVVDSDGK